MECPICKDKVPQLEEIRECHVVLHKNLDGHVHVHGDLDKKAHVQDMLRAAAEELNIDHSMPAHENVVPDEVVFHNRQRIGDMLVFTCAVRDFKKAFPNTRVNVVSTAAHIWDHNPYIDRTLRPTDKNTVKIGPSWLTNKSNALDWHFANAYRISIEQALNVNIPQGISRPDIWLTQEEYDAPRIFEKPYWIICITGEKGWGCKMFPYTKWQQFVSENPDTLFVQIGTREDNPPRLQGQNVIDYVGQTQDKNTGIRDLYKLFLNAEGSIGLVSFHMHLSGGFEKPAIVIAGAREPVSFTRYPGHAYLSTDGMLPCAVKACWHCDIKSCTNPVIRKNQHDADEIVPKCVDMITPQDVTRALRGFYAGGRLNLHIPSEKPKLRNIVPTPPKESAISVEKSVNAPVLGIPIPQDVINMHGMQWGGGCILKEDWEYINMVIDSFGFKSVLEFGSGLSTLLFYDKNLFVKSFETRNEWIERTAAKSHGSVIPILWDGRQAHINCKFDLAFVDGPSGPENRRDAMRLAAQHADFIIVHDGNTPIEKEHMAEMFPQKEFPYRGKGGRRCYFYARRAVAQVCLNLSAHGEAQTTNVQICPNKPHQEQAVERGLNIKIVSTARGWGGAGRSLTTIMKLLLEAGHSVEFIPFRNSVGSREWQGKLASELSAVKISLSYHTISEPCDLLFMYADDYIWEFSKPEIAKVFSKIKASRKVMMLNYRRGPVGKETWTIGWDKYMFLNSMQKQELYEILPGSEMSVLPPCTDLTPFLSRNLPKYDQGLRIIRHSSQGDTKFAKDFCDECRNILSARSDCSMFFLPGPSFLNVNADIFKDRVKKFNRTADTGEIANFVRQGNLFWYSLPAGYMDMGPRVIMEAMAAGLPVLADNWGGVVDRVSRETSWLCDSKNQHVEIIKHLTAAELEKKGRAAREHARQNFVPEKWVQEILGK